MYLLKCLTLQQVHTIKFQMKNTCISLALIFFSCTAYSQTHKKFSLQVNYGLFGNFFVRSYDEIGGPVNKKYFYKKNFIGTVGGAAFNYNISKRSSLMIEYNRSINLGKKNYAGRINGTDVIIRDFNLRHINNIYQLGYGIYTSKKSKDFKISIGVILLYDLKQEIAMENWDNYINIDERNFKNANSVEGGTFLGIEYSKRIDNKFNLGLKAKLYYLISTNYLEAISLTPTLTYHF